MSPASSAWATYPCAACTVNGDANGVHRFIWSVSNKLTISEVSSRHQGRNHKPSEVKGLPTGSVTYDAPSLRREHGVDGDVVPEGVRPNLVAAIIGVEPVGREVSEHRCQAPPLLGIVQPDGA